MTVFEFELGNKGLTKTALTEKNDFFLICSFVLSWRRDGYKFVKLAFWAKVHNNTSITYIASFIFSQSMSPVSPIFHIVSTVSSWSQTCS